MEQPNNCIAHTTDMIFLSRNRSMRRLLLNESQQRLCDSVLTINSDNYRKNDGDESEMRENLDSRHWRRLIAAQDHRL